MTAKDEAQKRYPLHGLPAKFVGGQTIRQKDFIDGENWREQQFKKLSMLEQTETVVSNGAEGVTLFGEPRNTTPLKTEAANKVINLSKQPNEIEQLQQRVKELEASLEEYSLMLDAELTWSETVLLSIDEFITWAVESGWRYYAEQRYWEKNWVTKTTPQLWAEWEDNLHRKSSVSK